MDAWFDLISAQKRLPSYLEEGLLTDGFIVAPGPLPSAEIDALADIYDQEVFSAAPDDVKTGSTTTRIRDFVNRDARFDDLYIHAPILGAACCVIGQPFRLSTMHARTLKPATAAQRLHLDFDSDKQGYPMIGFIYMIDEFTKENGATCFVRGSQVLTEAPQNFNLIPACGPAGSVIIFNGSTWHGHGENQTDQPRRSIQGAYIRRNEGSGEDLVARMRPETLNRIGVLAKYLLAL